MEALQELKDVINSPENLRIIPTSIHVQVVIKSLFMLVTTVTDKEISFRNGRRWRHNRRKSNGFLLYELSII